MQHQKSTETQYSEDWYSWFWSLYEYYHIYFWPIDLCHTCPPLPTWPLFVAAMNIPQHLSFLIFGSRKIFLLFSLWWDLNSLHALNIFNLLNGNIPIRQLFQPPTQEITFLLMPVLKRVLLFQGASRCVPWTHYFHQDTCRQHEVQLLQSLVLDS